MANINVLLVDDNYNISRLNKATKKVLKQVRFFAILMCLLVASANLDYSHTSSCPVTRLIPRTATTVA
jgi:uncharacterized membrane protein